MYDQCQEKDVPVSIFFRMVHFESNFDSTATSRVGAKGYCQVMPATFSTWYKKMGLSGGKTVTNNIKISVQLLSELEKNFIKYNEQKKWELVLSSYNAGIGRVIDAGYNIPNISETKKYVNNILNGVEL
jgi:soluble lytic murein transglycosylase-like protein